MILIFIKMIVWILLKCQQIQDNGAGGILRGMDILFYGRGFGDAYAGFS